MERTYTVRELFAAFHRRRWLALGITAAALVVSGASILLLPDEYRAESVMQIEPHRLPVEFFPAAAPSFEDRMRTLKHGVLARPVLERVLEETGLDPDWRQDPDKALEKLRRNIEVRLEGEVVGGPPSLLFVVEVRGKDPQKVAKAADLIPRAYAEMTRQVLQTQARNVRETLEQELEAMAKRLSSEEAKLVAFKAQHSGELPEATDANLREIGALGAQIDVRLGLVADAQRRRTGLIASLPDAHSAPGLAGANADEVLRRLEAARASYGDEHPDVKRLERQYDEAVARDEDQQARWKRERIQAQFDRIDAEIGDHRVAIDAMRKDVAAYQKRVAAAAGLGEQYRTMSRDYDALRAKYVSTVSRASDARAAEALLAADAATLFRVVQPAVAPSRPIGPNRLNLALVALAAALGAGLLAAAGAEYFDTSLRGAQDATEFGVPVLAAIPRIGPRRAGAGR